MRMNCFLNARIMSGLSSDGLCYIVILVCVCASREHTALHSRYPIVASGIVDFRIPVTCLSFHGRTTNFNS